MDQKTTLNMKQKNGDLVTSITAIEYTYMELLRLEVGSLGHEWTFRVGQCLPSYAYISGF